MLLKEKKGKGYWTYESCKIEALKYLYIGDFSKYSNGAYKSALKNEWIDDITKHMSNKNIKWDIGRMKNVLKKR